MAAVRQSLTNLPLDDRRLVEAWLDEFEAGWHPGRLAEHTPRLPSPGHRMRLVLLAEMVKVDLERQWRAGQRPSLETYLARFPELGTAGTVDAALVQAECDALLSAGKPIDWGALERRFPRQTALLRNALAEKTPAAPGSQAAAVPADTHSTAAATHSRADAGQMAGDLPEHFGRYRIIKKLGTGGMGTVYQATDTQLGRQVAIKVPRVGSDDTQEWIARFYREAGAAANFHHSNLCPVYDVGEIEGVHYLTMAYVDGQTLAKVIASVKNKPQSGKQVAVLLRTIALALTEAHRGGIIHRDLKPANIMIDRRGEPIVMDFGLARRGNADESRLTATGALLGTPAYMPPEQALNDSEALGPACDIYSLGVIFYELLCGRLPFEGPIVAVVGQILTVEPEPPSRRRAGVDPALEAICLKAMAKKPSARYASMDEFAAALTHYLRGGASTPRPIPVGLGTQLPPRVAKDQPAPLIAVSPTRRKRGGGTRPRGVSAGLERARRVWSDAKGWKRWAVAAGLAGALLWGVVILVRTPRGTVEIALSDPKAPVELVVDGNRIDVGGLDKPLSLLVGEHNFTVTGDGFETIAEKFTVTQGKNRPLTIKLKAAINPVDEDSEGIVLRTVKQLGRLREVDEKSRVVKLDVDFDGRPSEVRLFTIRERVKPLMNGERIFAGQPVTLATLRPGDQIEVQYIAEGDDHGVAALQAFRLITFEGLIHRYDADRRELEVADGAGEGVKTFTWPLAPDCTVTLNGEFASPRELAPGDQVTLQREIRVAKIEATRPPPTTTTAEDKSALSPETPPAVESTPKKNAGATVELAIAPFTAAEAKQYQERCAAALKIEPVITNSIGMDLVLLPPGKFTMGSPAGDGEASDDEKPQVEVTLTQPLYVGKTEVTQGQWQAVMNTMPWSGKELVTEGAEYAASYVTWDDAQKFCTKLGEIEGLTYRLLTEAEWEYACRAGTTTKYHFGDNETALGSYAWFDKNTIDVGEKYAHEVAKKQPNPFGLYDMHGNVWEWCDDVYAAKLPGGVNPGVITGGSYRVSRGGGWILDAAYCRTADRNRYQPSSRPVNLGFRLALVPFSQAKNVAGRATPSAAKSTPKNNAGETLELARAPFSAAEAKQHQDRCAATLNAEVVITNSIGMKLALIPPGEFDMGQMDGDSDERPTHRVRISRGFYLGIHEVTQAEYGKVTGKSPSRSKGDDLPVETVSAVDADKFCGMLTEREHSAAQLPMEAIYRLPTEAEWEYAARAGTTTKWYSGDDEKQLDAYAWYSPNSGAKTHPVGEKLQNAWGLFDMHGNVLEWCSDWYGPYGNAAVADPTGPKAGKRRVLRGGAFLNLASYVRSADRFNLAPTLRYYDDGFRVARTYP